MVYFGHFVFPLLKLAKKYGKTQKVKFNSKFIMLTIKIIFDRHGRATKNNPGCVDIRITLERKTYYINTGVKVLPSEWVAGAVSNRSDAEQLNERVRIIYNYVIEHTNELLKAGKPFSVAALRRKVWGIIEVGTGDSAMLEWMEKQISTMRLAEGTLKHYRTVLLRLQEYKLMRTWSDLTVENIYNWDNWLHGLKAPDGSPISDAGVYTYHKCLKALLRKAVKFERLDNNPYDRLRGEFKRGEKENVEFLTESDLARFEALRFPEGTRLAKAKDIFVFQCYTGLAYSDAMAFDINNYKFDGKVWSAIADRIKTGTPYVSQLLPPVVDVLERNDWKIPYMDNANYNACLKILGEAAEITTKMHTHLARHTFATLMLRSGAKIENVSRMLGHTNIIQTQRYAKVLAQSVHDDFDMVSEKLKKRKD